MKKYLLSVLCAVITISAVAQKKNIKIETFKVYGTCIQCKNRIESTLKDYGTYNSNWTINSNMLTVSYDSTKLLKEKIQQRLADVGHDTEAFQADDKTYENLPKCCYYDRYKKPLTVIESDTINTKPIVKNVMLTITGVVLEEDNKGKLLPLVGASIKCLTTNHGSNTDSSGVFQLNCNIPVQLEISYIGYEKDTIDITSSSEIKVILKNSSTSNLSEVFVKAKSNSTYVSSLSTFNTLNIGSKELTKAACCNLSESFETSPSIDVNYADAVTGIKQIQLLGLAGSYSQLLTENTPEIKGLAGSYGLTFIPGPWIEGIQVTKGTGSVANGYESIAGQINIEEKKPDKMDKLFVNAYANGFGRLETTVNVAKVLNDKWSTALLTHVNGVTKKNDANQDGFLDIPKGRQFNILNRWRYADTKGVFAQLAIKALNDSRQAGETDFDESTDKFTTNKYGVGIDVKQCSVTGKLGYVFPQKKYKSLGLIFSANSYDNKSYYGLTNYNAQQKSVYANLIYQSIIGNTNHKFRTGLSFANDHFNENYNARNFKRKEVVPGSFFEYTHTASKKFTAIAGFRLDYHNEYGLISTPRLHLKYDFDPKTNLRFSAGYGLRTANIFAENAGLFASSRKYNINNPSSSYGYGLDAEMAWNYGGNFIHNFKHNGRAGSISVDAYRTVFNNQVVVDVDANPQEINFYNLDGKSFSNSIQTELNYKLINKLDVRLAYRWLDVRTNYASGLLEKPLIAKHRAFINLAYETNNKWKFDWTTQGFSSKRLQNTMSNPSGKQMPSYSPSFIQMSSQVSKRFGKSLEIYAGVENLTGYTQKNLFISGDQPFSPYFDGSIVWGPVNGRMIYTGLRFNIK